MKVAAVTRRPDRLLEVTIASGPVRVTVVGTMADGWHRDGEPLVLTDELNARVLTIARQLAANGETSWADDHA